MAKYRRTCSKCHGPKEAGRGLRYCLSCERKPNRPANTKTPCHACGERENKQPRRHYCNECLELRRWLAERKSKTRKVLVRRPCRGCGGRKEPGHGQQFCAKCRTLHAQPPVCQRCQVQPVRAKFKRLCAACVSEAAVEYRRRERERGRKRARDRELTRAYRRRLKQDPARHAHDLESQRLRHRLRALREGRQPRVIAVPVERRVWVPGQPLAAALDRLALESDLEAVCELAGVSCRQVTRWRRGEQGVSTNDADLVLTGVHLLWWDVWNEDSVRTPLFEVCVYTWQIKTMRNGTSAARRVRVRVAPYGDAGPDAARLAEIAALMSGEAVAA